jgi:zinc/manganese transport system substrate-binding protein
MTDKAGKSPVPRLARAARVAALAGAAAALAATAAGCGTGAASVDAARSTPVINAIGTENEYASVLSQIGGRYVRVSSILNNPSTDPHTFEWSPAVGADNLTRSPSRPTS